jgi:hypothetical protein
VDSLNLKTGQFTLESWTPVFDRNTRIIYDFSSNTNWRNPCLSFTNVSQMNKSNFYSKVIVRDRLAELIFKK